MRRQEARAAEASVRSERERTAARERANRDQIAFIRNLRRQEERASQAAGRSKQIERTREFNRILRETTIISEKAAREIANDFADIEGSLQKAITAYKRGQREAERFYKEQEEAAKETASVVRRSRQTFSALFHNVANGVFIFQELRYAIGNVLGSIIDVTARTQTMRATLRVTETDVRGVGEELLELNRTLLGINVDTLLSGFTRFRVAGADIDEAKIALSAVAKATAELGKSTEVTERVVEQLTQSYAQNVADAQDLKTLFRELPQLMEAATNALDFQVQGWRDFGAAAKASGVDIRQAWRLTLRELNRTSLGGDRNTFAAQSEIFTENINDLRRAIGEQLVPAITQGLNAINQWLRSGGIESISGGFQTLSRNIVPATLGIGAFFGIRGLRGGIPHIRTAVDRLRELQGTFRQYDSGVASAVFNTRRWRDSLVIAERNAADANAQVARSVALYGQADRRLIANAESTSKLNEQLKTVNTQLRGFSSVVKSTLIDVGISAAIGVIIAAWQDHNRQVKAAERLIKEVRDSYTSSLGSILTAVKDLDNIDLDNVSRELQRVLRDIAEARQQYADLYDPGFFSNLNPFDNDAIASQRQSLQQAIRNAELQADFLRALSDDNQNNADALAKVRADVQSEVDKLQSIYERQKNAFDSLVSSGSLVSLGLGIGNRLSAEFTTNLSRIESDLIGLENIIKRIDNLAEPSPVAPTETPILLIDIDKARAEVEDAQLSLNQALEAGNRNLARTLYQETASSYVALATLQRSYAKQTITDAAALNRELYKINRDLFTNTRDLFTSTQENISNITTAAQAGLDQIKSNIAGLRTGFKESVDSITSEGNRLVSIFAGVRDALKPVTQGILETSALARRIC